MKKHLLVSICLAAGLIVASCGKDSGGGGSSTSQTQDTSTIETFPVPNHKTQGLDLGVAKSFAVMAYTAVQSVPQSNISGKVGVKPGGKAASVLSTSEVAGGSSDIYVGDEEGDKADYLTMAREDMIAAYRDAEGRTTDKDKMEPWRGDLSGKDLPAGVYRLANGLAIGSDTTIKGNESDVWIFQINGNLDVADGVKISVEGGRASNIYWQVSGKVTLGTNSSVPGTIISQLTLEMKQGAKVRGRAFCKNGKVLLNQNTIGL